MRLKTSRPCVRITSPFGPTEVAVHRATIVVGVTKRPRQTAVTLQSAVHVREVSKPTHGPRMRPARLYGTTGHGADGSLRNTPLKLPIPGSPDRTFSSAPRSLRQTDGNRAWAEAAVAVTRNKAAMTRDMLH